MNAGTSSAVRLAGALSAALVASCGGGDDNRAAEQAALVEQGRQIFRFDTFGDEAQWTDALRLHEVISAAVDPVTALSVGLKVDADRLPAAVVDAIRNGSIDLTRPATTVALLELDAVVGVKGTVETVNGVDTLTRVGITCALGRGQVRSAAQHRRLQQAGRHPAGLWPARHPPRHLHRRRHRAGLLEPLCRGGRDGRPGAQYLKSL